MSRPDREVGTTVVEIVVAMTLLATVFASVTALMSWTAAGLGVASDRDGAQQVADATLEEATSAGCGLVTGAESSAVLARWQRQCWGGLGDSSYDTAVGTTTYTATLHTAWRQSGAGAGACVDPQAATTRPKPILAQADGLERRVTVAWAGRGGRHDLTADDYESVPPDAVAYHDTSTGAVLLHGAAGSIATVAVPHGPSAPTTVTRTIDSTGCAFFPFLPTGSTAWTAGSSRGTATVVAAEIAVEPGDGVIS
jgi:hypothetical protein